MLEISISAGHVCNRPCHLGFRYYTVFIYSTKFPVKPCKPAERSPLKSVRLLDPFLVRKVSSCAPSGYLLASQRNGTLYVGVTANLVQRIWPHKEGVVKGFPKKYGVKTRVWYEQHATMESALSREKAIKEWKRAWKLELIKKTNPEWRDGYAERV